MGRAIPPACYPPSTLSEHDATLIRWRPAGPLHRIHLKAFEATKYNDSPLADARFSPLLDASGGVVPVLYGGATLDCALMETVFHDVPPGAGLKTLSRSRVLRGYVHSTVAVHWELELVDLSSIALTKLGILRKHLLETERHEYDASRQWARSLYSLKPEAQGLLWTSKKDDKANACMLFGDRVPLGTLEHLTTSVDLHLAPPDLKLYIELLAGRLGVKLIP